jgi:hypothetical protein
LASAGEISDEIRRYIATVIEEDADKNRDHLKWLEENPEEPDREQQRAECERAVELARAAQKFFAAASVSEDG